MDAKTAIAGGATPATAGEEAEGAKPAKSKKVKEPKAKKVSAIDAAVQVLAASSEPVNSMVIARDRFDLAMICGSVKAGI